jgi:hypothetical protein
MSIMIAQLSRYQVEVIENESKAHKGSLAQVLYLLKMQAELMMTLTNEEIKTLNYILNEKLQLNTNLKDKPITELMDEPEFLTTLDVAEILAISPQMVRKRCMDGSIRAWRTLGDRGEWRIDVEPFRNHPRYQAFLRQRAEHLEDNQRLFEVVQELSADPEYKRVLDDIQEDREKDREEFDV